MTATQHPDNIDTAATGPDLWNSPAWRSLALAWLDEQLAAAGIERTGDVAHEQVRSWAAVLKFPTTAGPVWLKAAGPSTAFEVPLYPLLQEAASTVVLTPIAVDPARGWVVLPDGGQPLGTQRTGEALVESLVTLLPRYGHLQRELMPQVDTLLEIGVPDLRPSSIPDRYAESLALVEQFVAASGNEEDRERLAQVAGLHSRVASWSAELAAAPGDPTLDHSDLHTWNILLPASGDLEQATFFDWGDSVVAHPFTSMLVALRMVRWQLKVESDDPNIIRIRDAYLGAFSDLASHTELVATVERACHLGKIGRALTWATVAGEASVEEQPEMYRNALAWLEMLLDDAYLGVIED